MDDNAASVRLARCAKTFADGTRALQPLDLDIAAGETIVFLGPSGCGKTTLLRIIAGLTEPDAGGRVFFGGDDVTARPIERRNVGMVFQSYALFPNMSVIDNVAYGLRVRGVAVADRREQAMRLLAMMHLEGFGDRRVDQLSGGQRQRVALARALAVKPRVLLLDEPLTALDAKLREDLRVEIDRLLRSLGVTSVYVTHDQAEAMALGDRIAVMSHGRVEQIGTPQDIYYRPASAFVADFIGTMNRVSGVRENGALRIPSGILRLPPGITSASEVMFRPEDARVVDIDGAALRGSIVSAFFLGNLTRIVVDLNHGQSIVVDTVLRRTFAKGEAIGIDVDPGALVMLEGRDRSPYA
ncbi:MAG TPA: ABC transporter ATP-binding protein [Casimicrobiaceae bacterium]|nr:ABC transporter ATP-binding protein [Casimicrobiaceae bacterium]